MSDTPEPGYTPPPPTHPHYGYMTAEEIAAQQEQEAGERGSDQGWLPTTPAEAGDEGGAPVTPLTGEGQPGALAVQPDVAVQPEVSVQPDAGNLAKLPDEQAPAWVPSAPEPVVAAATGPEGEALVLQRPGGHEEQWGSPEQQWATPPHEQQWATPPHEQQWGQDNGYVAQPGAAPDPNWPGYPPAEGLPAGQPPRWGGSPQQWGQEHGDERWQQDPTRPEPGEQAPQQQVPQQQVPQQWRQWPDPNQAPPPGTADPPVHPAAGTGVPSGGAGTAYPLGLPGDPDFRPLAHDLMETRSRRDIHGRRATKGWRAALGNVTGGLIAPGPGQAEQREQAAIHRIVRPVAGRKTIMVINTKGGGGKTLVTLMLAAYLGRYRTGNTLAWDNNETEGTLGMRAPYRPHNRTVVDLLNELATLKDNRHAGPGELGRWVREQGAMKFDVLASADDDESMRVVGGSEFRDLHEQLSRFYRVIVVDTGNNRLAPNWLAAVEEADELVFATSLKDDVAVVAAKNLDAIVAAGKADVIRNAVCVISHTLERSDPTAFQHTRNHFQQWVRAVVDVPYDPLLGPGLQLDPTRLKPGTHRAWLDVTAAVVDGL